MKTTDEIRALARGNDVRGAIEALCDRLDAAEETMAIAAFDSGDQDATMADVADANA